MASDSIEHFQGPFGDREFPVSDTTVQLESLRVRGTRYNYEISQHLHSEVVQVFFFDHGQGVLHTEREKLAFNGPGIAFIPAGIVHGFTFPEDIRGEVLTLSTSLFESVLDGLPDLSLHFETLHSLKFTGNEAAFEELRATRARFHAELADDRPAREKIIRLLSQILVVRLYRVVVEHARPARVTDNRMLAYYTSFMRRIKHRITLTRTVTASAGELGISPGHLNRVCRQLVGKSALHLIHEQIAREARGRLLTTDQSVSEISYALEFRDPSHFSKFFKRVAGMSPRAYRQRMG